MEDGNVCVSCQKGCGDHSCRICKNPCHAIPPCAILEENEENEGYGSKVLCKQCKPNEVAITNEEVNKSEEEVNKKTAYQWWKKTEKQPTMKRPVVDKYKERPAIASKAKKSKEDVSGSKYVCKGCLTDMIAGKRTNKDKRSPYMCRNDKYSIDRHKSHWHVGIDSSKCVILPADSSEVVKLLKTLSSSPKENLEVTTIPSTSIMPQPLPPPSASPPPPSSPPSQSDSDDVDEGADVVESSSSVSMVEQGQKDTKSAKKLSSTVLDYFKDSKSDDSTNDATLNDILEAIKKLDIKVSDFGKHHRAITEIAFEDKELRKVVTAMRGAKNIHELVEANDLLQFFYNDDAGTAILRCSVCFEYHCLNKVHFKGMTPFKAAQKLCDGPGTLATGLFVSPQVSKLIIEGHNATWSNKKKLCTDHFTLLGKGTSTHWKAMKEYQKVQKHHSREVQAAMNIFRAAIIDVKMGAAGSHLETLLSLLSLCGVDVGDIGHSRKHFPAIVKSIERAVDERCATWLNTPLPSTGLPPHIWVTMDKATPSRTTNQALLLVGRDKQGTPCPFPVDAPKVYDESFEAASYDRMADLVTTSLATKYSKRILNRVCGVAADGPYQATGFRDRLMETLDVQDASTLALPVTWDPAHLINLGVTDVLNKDNASGKHFRRFIKRTNVFHTVMANGKGFAFLENIDSKARRPVSYATQRFASSSYNQWVKIEESYEAYWQTFEHLYPVREEEEEYQYMIAGYDFVSDLLAFLDTIQPVVDLMLRVQSLDCPIWKLKKWWPIAKARLQELIENDDFPRIKKYGIMEPSSQFKGVTLLDGWLFEESEGKGKSKVYIWTERDEEEVHADHIRFVGDLLDSIDARVQNVTASDHLNVLEVFDAVNLVVLQCGARKTGSIVREKSNGHIEDYGVCEAKKLLKVISKMKEVRENDLNFDSRMAHRYMMGIKEAVYAGVWDGLCPNWFVDIKTNKSVPVTDFETLLELTVKSLDMYEPQFILVFDGGNSVTCRLHDQSVYAAFYGNEAIYEKAGPHSCIIIDVILAKGGPEAIAESFYATMRSQQQGGGQHNDTLVTRAKLSWCLPSLRNCEQIIREGIKIYHDGDGDKIKKHRRYVFTSNRHMDYGISKVLDRVDIDEGRCPFLN